MKQWFIAACAGLALCGTARANKAANILRRMNAEMIPASCDAPEMYFDAVRVLPRFFRGHISDVQVSPGMLSNQRHIIVCQVRFMDRLPFRAPGTPMKFTEPLLKIVWFGERIGPKGKFYLMDENGGGMPSFRGFVLGKGLHRP